MNANRRFLYEMLGSGLDLGTITPDDVLRHVTPEILAHHLPVTLKAKLLEASLAAEKMTPGLVVETIGIDGLADHSPIAALWGCLSECARRLVNEEEVSSPSAATIDGAVAGGELKPNKSARPVRLPGRISALSPRSRSATAARTGRPDEDDGKRSEPEFDIDESSDDFTGSRQTREITPDEETRPGDVTGRKL
jgi:hypothetical protein